ncbi:MAG: flagellar type III secretion system pore protein FliP [bacterium]|nr:flagellar type III secretion system pore protein FliP [bacterium]
MSVASRAFLVATVLIGSIVGGTADAQEFPPDPFAQVDTVEAPEAETVAESTATTTPLVVVPEVEDVPDIAITVESENGALSNTVIIIIMLTIGSVAPSIMLLMTSFTRFIIVLGLTRNAIGVQTIPPSQVLIGLAIFLTIFVMGPVFSEVNEVAVQPMLAGEIGQAEAMSAGYEPFREFMLAQTSEDDLRLFMDLSNSAQPTSEADVPATTLVPAFVISELRSAFTIGFVIFVPFLVIDLIVAAVLMSMGMVMLPPVFISLPLKLLLFVLVDGWALLIGSVVESVQGAVG